MALAASMVFPGVTLPAMMARRTATLRIAAAIPLAEPWVMAAAKAATPTQRSSATKATGLVRMTVPEPSEVRLVAFCHAVPLAMPPSEPMTVTPGARLPVSGSP